ncbi:MAG TPA: MogA/MoaB family molybdenum cofactor biosynthesis protein [Nitrososphaerales archaeon]|nr:MogA/MoaB family molybdenum cofactor biosynthesis protein [Nitrososphaerales archaeon]
MRPHEQHRKKAERRLRVAVVTVSTSRYAKMKDGSRYTDEGGDAAAEEAERVGHTVSRRILVSDDRTMLRKEVRRFLAGRDEVLLLTGGTGLSPRDVTVETVRPYFEKELDGFGELVRRLGYEEIGGAAILTRATAGVASGKLIVCMPGSPGAVRTAMKAFAREFAHALFIAAG